MIKTNTIVAKASKRERTSQSPDSSNKQRKMDVEMTDSNQNDTIDEGLYSRQLYVMGFEAMRKMGSSNILVIGLSGLGVEIAKNLILTGVKSVTICDDTPVSLLDLSSQFYLTQKDIGKPRAASCMAKLAELNSLVNVQLHTGSINEQLLKRFQVVLMTNQPLDLMLTVNKFCHENNIAFVSTEIRGCFSNIFCDFGNSFVVHDTNGENPVSLMVANVTQENPGVVTVVDDTRIPYEDGDYVSFSEVQGMTELNSRPPQPIKLLGPYTFSIEDTSKFSAYKTGGSVVQVKQSKTMSFLPLAESLENPEFVLADFAKMEQPAQLHLGFQALHEFFKRHKKYPAPRNQEDAKEVLEIVRQLNEKTKSKVEKIDEPLLRALAFGSSGELVPAITFIGGVAAQEVLKACSGKFTPIKQWFYFDAIEALPTEKEESPLPAEEFQPIGSRYDAQIAVIGKTLQQKIMDLRVFLVGAGAIGCEVLKIWAMTGVGTSPQGMIHVTDLDVIEKSNLSRQFLFRPKDVEKLKSTTAANAVKEMNPQIQITSYSIRVGPETEDTFNDKFYGSLALITNALDNVEARMYMDRQAIFYKKPLLESGTLGTKGNTQVVVPDTTESYSSSRDPPEKGIPICTLHHFPNAIEHTIQWARDVFEGLYKNQVENVNSYLSNPNFAEVLQKQSPGARLETLQSIKSYLVDDKPISFEQCVVWARLKFEEYFNNNIKQLLYNFPLDMITSTGTPFWSGPKRAPKYLDFDMDDPLHLEFIISAANLRAKNYGLKGERDPTVFKKVLPNVIVPEFTPKKGVKISTNDQEAQEAKQQAEEDESDTANKILSELPPPSKLAGYRMSPIDFEKDDDTNFHMDFITAAANLRASNYSIPQADKHKCKGIAGKIIPAMITTTAVVSGLVCIELIKLLQGKTLDDYKNGFVNLALPFFGFSTPIEPQKTKIRDDWSWTLWDRFEVEGPMTLKQFIQHFKDKYHLEITMISSGVSMIYSFFMNKDKLNERLNKELAEVISSVSKQPLPTNKSYLTLEICCNDLKTDDEAEVDVPFVQYKFRS